MLEINKEHPMVASSLEIRVKDLDSDGIKTYLGGYLTCSTSEVATWLLALSPYKTQNGIDCFSIIWIKLWFPESSEHQNK